jgi:TolA-binding protein
MRPWLLVPAALLLAACGGGLAEGEGQFRRGRYPEAKQTFAALESEIRDYPDAKRAEYALYRGLTLGALGDRAQAGVWLREAKALEDARPGSLSAADAARLKEGLEANDVN